MKGDSITLKNLEQDSENVNGIWCVWQAEINLDNALKLLGAVPLVSPKKRDRNRVSDMEPSVVCCFELVKFRVISL